MRTVILSEAKDLNNTIATAASAEILHAKPRGEEAVFVHPVGCAQNDTFS